MRQLIKTLLTVALLSPSFGWAFTDPATLMAVEVAHQEMREARQFSTRMSSLAALRKLVNERLNTIDLPNPLSLPDNDPRIENFRSLNEFEGYLDLMITRRVSIGDCSQIAQNIRSSSSKAQVAAEAQTALDLLKSACAQ